MKFVSLFTLLMLSNLALSQNDKGTVIAEVYYGFPNIAAVNAKNSIQRYTSFNNAYNITNYRGTVKSFGPIGLRIQRTISDNFSIGLDVCYLNVNVLREYDEKVSVYDPITQNSSISLVSQRLEDSKTKIRAMLTFNFHLLEDEEQDAYFIFGAGYLYNKLQLSNKPTQDFYYFSQSNIFNSSFFTLTDSFPVALRLGFGYRYFFNENIGLNCAIGIGGALVSGGITYRLYGREKPMKSLESK